MYYKPQRSDNWRPTFEEAHGGQGVRVQCGHRVVRVTKSKGRPGFFGVKAEPNPWFTWVYGLDAARWYMELYGRK